MENNTENGIITQDFMPGAGGIDEDFILKLFNLHSSEVAEISCTHEGDGIHVGITLSVKTHRCPCCTAPTKKIKDYHHRRITHSILNNVRCVIDYRARRYRCPACGKTFTEDNPFAVGHSRISVVTVYNILTDLKNRHMSFTDIAERYDISVTSAVSIFDRHVRIARRPLPEYILIDEVYTGRITESPYACVLMDYVTQDIIDILPSRKKYDLMSYFMMIPEKERRNVKMLCSDCWETYRIVARHCFPNVKVACDEFHIIQIYTRIYDRIRIDAAARMKRKRNSYQKMIRGSSGRESVNPSWQEYDEKLYLIKKFDWLLTKADDTEKPDGKRKHKKALLDPNNHKKFNKKLKRYLNYYDIYNMIMEADSQLAEADNFYNRLRDFYRKTSYDEADSAVNELISDFRLSAVNEIRDFAKTLTKWKREIVSSFRVIEETGKHISNGAIEGKNKYIKDIKRISNGMGNFERLRNRTMYCLNQNASFYLLPGNDSDN